MIDALTYLHAAVSILMVILILMQFGKGAEAGLFSSSEGAMFTGAQKGNILTKSTTILVILFLGLSVGLASLRSRADKTSSVFDESVTPSAPILNEEALNDELNKKSVPATETKKTDSNKTKNPKN